MKSNSKLPFTTDNHEYFISWDKETALIKVAPENEADLINNPITLDELKEMILSAATYEVKKVVIDCKHSIEVHSHTMKQIEEKYNIKITRKIEE